jgi:4-amino-4-deoxy-L-arabinose transferase-like glycosyltransferase
VLHLAYAAWFGGGEAAREAYFKDPTGVLLLARVIVAMCGTLAVGLLYLAGARLFDRRVALLAAGLMAVAFLPVFYSHLALNDVPALATVCLALWGAAGVMRHGRLRDYAVAGLGVGLACATKYRLVELSAARTVRGR